MRRARFWCTALAGLALATRMATAATTHVDYVAGGSLYLDAGQIDGIAVGDSVRVLREGEAIALLRVSRVSRHHASCDTVWTRVLPAPGDSASTFGPAARIAPTTSRAAAAIAPVAESATATAAAIAAPATATAAAIAAPAAAAVLPPLLPAPVRALAARPRLRGRLGAHWSRVRDDGGGGVTQPGFDVRADAAAFGEGHLDLALDVRGRRTTRDYAGASSVADQYSRVYRATLTVRDVARHHLATFGRQVSPTLAAVSVFDGVLVQSVSEHRTLGLFSGTSPDPRRYAFSRDQVQSGAFAEWHSPATALAHSSLAFGGVTSQAFGLANRDFFFVQANHYSARTSVSFTQEVDANDGWRRVHATSRLSPTSTFASARHDVKPWLSVSAGFDNRRNVRVYRDRLTPETQFDDSYRQGSWQGAGLRMGRWLRADSELRQGAGGGAAHGWSQFVDMERAGHVPVGLQFRASRYAYATLVSRLYSAGLRVEPWPGAHVAGTAGRRESLDPTIALEESEHWQRIDADVAIASRLLADFGWERDFTAGIGRTLQYQAGLSWRL